MRIYGAHGISPKISPVIIIQVLFPRSGGVDVSTLHVIFRKSDQNIMWKDSKTCVKRGGVNGQIAVIVSNLAPFASRRRGLGKCKQSVKTEK